MRSDIARFDREVADFNEEEPSTCYYRVIYQDYIIAKNIAKTLDDWVDALHEVKVSWYFPSLQRSTVRDVIRRSLIISSYAASLLLSLMILNKVLPAEDAPITTAVMLLGAWGAISCFAGAFLAQFAGGIFEKIKKSVDSTEFISVILFTNGDKIRFDKRTEQNKAAMRTAAMATASLAVSYAVGVAASLSANWWVN